jgi:RNA polymerase sigma-70 factor (ECF subfamily)
MIGPTLDTPAAATRPQSPETRLLERVRDRTDAGAWSEFVAAYQPVLRAFVRRHGVFGDDILDVVQEILTRLVSTLARFEYDPARGRFRTWLWRIAGRAAANWHRKRASRIRAEAAWHRNRTMDTGAPDSMSEFDRASALLCLDQVLAEVRGTTAPATWACFEGQFLRGRAAGEIATELGLSLNAVYVNACRVRARVRERGVRFPHPVSGA